MGKIREEPPAEPVACSAALAIFTAACLTVSAAFSIWISVGSMYRV